MKETENKTGKARMELVVSMTVFGTLAVFVREIPLPSGELALYRAVLAALLILVYFLAGKTRIQVSLLKKELAVLLLSGAAMGLNWILLFEAYRYTTVSAATLSYYAAPVIVTMLCPVFFHENLTKKQVLCFVMSTAGVVLIIGIRNLTGGGKDLVGILLGLGAAVFYAAVILLNKLIKGVSGIQRTFLQFLAAIAVLIPYVACTGGFHLAELSGAGWGSLLIVGLFHTGVTYCLYFSALKELRGRHLSARTEEACPWFLFITLPHAAVPQCFCALYFENIHTGSALRIQAEPAYRPQGASM